MKIGILTFHNADNYGAVLQCYALQETLKKQYPNDDIYVIDYKSPKIVNSYIPKIKIHKPWTIWSYYKAKKKMSKFSDFRKKFFSLGTDNLSQYDIIYYGSDQIWNPNLTDNDLIYFGKGFLGKKIAYAASDGGEINLTPTVIELLNTFSFISCREKSLTEKLQNINIKLPIKTICDPVFLLSKEEWLKIAQLPQESNYVLAYKIGENLQFDNEAEKLGHNLGKKVIQIVYVRSLRKYYHRIQNYVEGISPEEFVGYFVNADFVLTTSFHGTAFSIIFEKPFYVLYFDKRNDRVVDLLDALKIKDRFVSSVPITCSNFCNYSDALENYVRNGLLAC